MCVLGSQMSKFQFQWRSECVSTCAITIVLFSFFFFETWSQYSSGYPWNSLWRPGWPQTPRALLSSASWVLRLKAQVTTLGFRGQLPEVSSHFTMWVQGLNSAQSHLAPSAFIHRAMSLATVQKREMNLCVYEWCECILLHARVHIVGSQDNLRC